MLANKRVDVYHLGFFTDRLKKAVKNHAKMRQRQLTHWMFNKAEQPMQDLTQLRKSFEKTLQTKRHGAIVKREE